MVDDPSRTVARFVAAFDAADRDEMAASLAPDLVADVTQADGSVVTLQGNAAYLAAIDAMDLPSVRPSIRATQIAPVSEDQSMVMVEIKAERKGHHLHNFAAFLMRVTEGKIVRIWMVDALPEESDRFWKR
ncbi:MAG: nuclear transport factor 2 family protein [Pseudomonadota bacterium]